MPKGDAPRPRAPVSVGATPKPKYLLCEELGIASRTLEKFIHLVPVVEETGGIKYYWIKDAIRVLLRAGYSGWGLPRGRVRSSDTDEEGTEKSRYDRARRRKIEIQVAILQNRVIPVDTVTRYVSTLGTSVRQKILGLTNRVAGAVQTIETAEEIAAYIDRELKDALEDLADGKAFSFIANEYDGNDDDEDEVDDDRGGSSEEFEAAPEPEDE